MRVNRELARIFEEMSIMLELEEVKWEPRAYRNAARGVKNFQQDVREVYEEEGKKGLKQIPGVGDSIAGHIIEYLEEGSISKFERLREKYSEEVTELVTIEGLGPKSVKKLIKGLGISSVNDLREAAEEEKIRELKGFGEKTEENILDALEVHERGKGRMLLSDALSVAEDLVEYLKEKAPLDRINYVGSLRRMKETIGDVDILVVSDQEDKVMSVFTGMEGVHKIISKGPTRSSLELKPERTHVDLRVIPAESYAAALMYFTGSKEHNIALRKAAVKQGFKLSEYGLFRRDSGDRVIADTEEQVYGELGFSFIPPELREDRGELDAAEEGELPELVKGEEVRGDFHMHTTYSDGSNSVEEMVRAAQDRGYDFVVVSDHSQSSHVAGGLTPDELREQWKELEGVAGEVEIRVLRGAEVDILEDGSLDYPDDLLGELHVVVGAVHSHLNMSEEGMTERICKALENPFLDILAHPSGRLLGKRERFKADFGRIFEKAAGEGVVLEVNCQPERLDLNDVHILLAKKMGAKFVINTDASSVSQLGFMRYGVGQARRGWLTAEDVVNTYSWKRLRKFFPRLQ